MPYNETSYKASVKYKAHNIKRVPLDMQIAEYEQLKRAADRAGESVNGYVKRAIKARIESEEK